jgi:hypothetical protein
LNVVDLHTHTTESDGTLTPLELVRAAARAGLRTLAVTDHDSISGYTPEAVAEAECAGITFIRGIELTCQHAGRSVHLLGYFFNGVRLGGFNRWLDELLASRRDRNVRLALRLRELGLDIHVEEADRYGHRLTGRPHFARVLIDKGYVGTVREAFDRYIGEAAPGYVERDSPDVAQGVARMIAAGAVPSLAHPGRTGRRNPVTQETMIAEFARAGLPAIEAYHSDHTAADTRRFVALAARYRLAVSGGSDFHGTNKPGIELGMGINGNLQVPEWVVPALRERSR